jgi:hypothetical protein
MYYYGSTGKCKDQLEIYRTSHVTQINDIVMEPLGVGEDYPHLITDGAVVDQIQYMLS